MLPANLETRDMPAMDGMSSDDMIAIHNKFFNETKSRGDILEFEKQIQEMPTSFDECPYPLFHSFADGMYTREIHFNKGHLIVGAIHRNEYFVNVLKGRIWVVSEFGSREIVAPASFKAKAGVKHIGYTLEDTVWIDTHKVESTNVEDAEKEIFVQSYDDLAIDCEYVKMCEDVGIPQQDISSMSELDEGIIDLTDDESIEVRESLVDGMGVFTTKDFKSGDTVTIARIGDKRTLSGRYVNHSDNPNVKPSVDGDTGIFIAIGDILKGVEIVANYRDVVKKSELLDEVVTCQVG